jgi:phospholipase/carboxylesterase
MSAIAAPIISAPIQDPVSRLNYRVRRAAGDMPAARLLLLHGVGSNETNLVPLASLIDPAVEVLLVRGPVVLGPQQFAWFPVQFGAQGPEIDAEQAERSRVQLIQLVQQHAGLPVVMAGFSQGGIMSASVGLTAPRDVAGFAVLSGRILPEIAARIAPREDLAHLSAFIGHGRLDDKLPMAWAERADAWLTSLGVPHRTTYYPVGHGLSAEMAHDFGAWLADTLRDH